MGGVDQLLDVLDGAVVGMDVGEVGDVVAAVAQRRAVERQQPDAVDPEPLQVVELLGQPAEVARAVAVGVEEAADVDLVEDRALEPQRLGLEPLPGLRLRCGARVVAAWARARRVRSRVVSVRSEWVSVGGPTDSGFYPDHVRLADAGLEADVVRADPPLEALVGEQVVRR